MELVRGIQSLTRSLRRPVVCIGNFDGVHLGHQHIIGTAVEKARARGGTAVAFTFRPHPQVALRPESNVQLLSTYDEKAELLGRCGIDVIIEEPFSREFSTTSPESFFTDSLIRRLSCEAIVVGYDFAFGKERQGHLDSLGALCKAVGVELTVVPPQRIEVSGNADVVSSSRIRQHLLKGEMESASALLGREFFYRGIVIKGEGRGRKIGFPTANLKIEDKLTLPYGVYATWAVLDGRILESVTNVGVRPTFFDEKRAAGAGASDKELAALVETHILDQTIDLYGTSLEVRFVRKLRDERKFSGIDSLKAQISLDVAEARKALASAPA